MKASILTLAAVFALLAAPRSARAQGTAFTYQGQLQAGGVAANGNFDLRFGLYTNVATGSLEGGYITNFATAVSNGLFTTTLNFSNAFNGTAYWLDVGVRTNGSTGAFTDLSPRQPITPAPYAIMAASASNLVGTLPATQLSGPLPASYLTGAYSNAVSFTNIGNVFSGNGSGLTGLVTPTQGNYVFALDTTVQEVTVANTFQTITINTLEANAGWTPTVGGIYTVNQSGLYLVQYHVHLQSVSTSLLTAGVRALVNSTSEILGSESIVGLEPEALTSVSQSFLFQFTAGQTLAFQVQANAAASAYLVSGTFNSQSYPCFTVTIVRLL